MDWLAVIDPPALMCCRSEVRQTSWVISLSVPHQALPTASIKLLGHSPVGVMDMVPEEGKSALEGVSGLAIQINVSVHDRYLNRAQVPTFLVLHHDRVHTLYEFSGLYGRRSLLSCYLT